MADLKDESREMMLAVSMVVTSAELKDVLMVVTKAELKVA